MSWGDDLRAARQVVGLSREALARISGLSASTVKSYEDGSRNPSRPMLIALLYALRVDLRVRNSILIEAGFAPDLESETAGEPSGYMYSLEEAKEHVDQMPWPAFVFKEVFEVVCANEITERVWDIDLEREFTPGIERNMLAVSSRPRFTDICENWDDMARVAIAILKGHHRGAEQLEQLSPYFAEVMQRFQTGNPQYVGRFLALWQGTPARDPKIRFLYPAVFNLPGIGRMSFISVVNTCNEPEGLAFNDWVPTDAESWVNLEKLRRSPRRR
ncbi:MAG: helix-turn-helix domain-containing protein [Chloroflexota bacterium]